LVTGKPVGETVLFFGCRKSSEDFIYREELEEYVKKGVLKVI
jgi:NADPH-ferrihemoprotein reductase